MHYSKIPDNEALFNIYPDAYLATKIPDMSGKNLTYGNPKLHPNTSG